MPGLTINFANKYNHCIFDNSLDLNSEDVWFIQIRIENF